MPWSGGVFTRTNGPFTGNVWSQDAAAGTKITSAHHDTHDQDLADGINNCMTKDGQNAATGDLDMGGRKLLNLSAGSSSTDSARYGQTINSASLDAGTNVLTLVRGDGDITVDLTPIVVGASYGSLANKSANETITGNWIFSKQITINAPLGSGWRVKSTDGTNYGACSVTDKRVAFQCDVNELAFDESGAQYNNNTIWHAANFNPGDYSLTTHSHFLKDLYGVTAHHPTGGDILQYNDASGAWEATALAAISGVVRSVAGTSPVSVSGTTDVTISVALATTSTSGLLSAADKTKLDALPSTAVASFKGRTGAVTPAAADYNIQQVSEIYWQGATPVSAGADNALWFQTVGSGPGSRGVYVRKSNAWTKVADVTS